MERTTWLVVCAWLWADLGGAQPATPPAASVAPAEVVHFASASLGSERAFTLLLPTDYARSSEKRYPVLYLLHGGARQDHTAFAERPWFREQASRDLMIVTPNGGDSWYVNSVADPKARYEDFIIKDLVHYVDAHYRTIASRRGRAIAGISMGGWGATVLGLKHPELFGAVGSLSSPFGISRHASDVDMGASTQQIFGPPGSRERRERDPASLVTDIPLDAVPHLYVACGAEDMFLSDNRAFVERLTERRIPYEYREISPAGHSWELWDRQIPSFIEMFVEMWASRTETAR
ncbi:MAG: alpha/beta hydrolase [Vicinamibacteraceae bacterium]